MNNRLSRSCKVTLLDNKPTPIKSIKRLDYGHGLNYTGRVNLITFENGMELVLARTDFVLINHKYIGIVTNHSFHYAVKNNRYWGYSYKASRDDIVVI